LNPPRGHQTSDFDELPDSVHGRQSRAQRQGVDANAVGDYERVGNDIKGVRAALERLEGRSDILGPPDIERGDFEAKRACCSPNLAYVQRGVGIADIGHDRQPVQTGDELAQKFEPLAHGIGPLARQAGDVAARPRKACNNAAADRIAVANTIGMTDVACFAARTGGCYA
jgi:hypothetical protein